jgi:hypothetical protein
MNEIKYYLRVLGIWIRVPRKIFYKNKFLWSMMKYEGDN